MSIAEILCGLRMEPQCMQGVEMWGHLHMCSHRVLCKCKGHGMLMRVRGHSGGHGG